MGAGVGDTQPGVPQPDERRGEYISLPQEKVIYGPGSLTRLPDEADRIGGQRALLITGRSLASRTPLVAQVEGLLGDRHAATFAGIRQHAPESGIQAAVSIARDRSADALISLGGGSPIDAAKAVAREMAAVDGAYPPHLAIPTTLSAAEFSHLAGYTDEVQQAKTGFADPRVTPRVVLLDPEVTLHTPLWLWLSSGIRALDHAVETLYSPGYHPVSDTLALQAIQDLFSALLRAKAEPDDLDARQQGQLAAWMSFFAPASVQLGLSHRLGRIVGATYGVPHGVTSCIFLPHVMRALAPREAARLAPMARALDLAPAGTPDIQAALAAAGAVADLVARLELPGRLRDVNVPERALEEIARSVNSDPARIEMAVEILGHAW